MPPLEDKYVIVSARNNVAANVVLFHQLCPLTAMERPDPDYLCNGLGKQFNTMKSVCPYSQCSHLKPFDNFPSLIGVDAQNHRGLDAFGFFFKNVKSGDVAP